MKNEKKANTWRSLLLVGITGAVSPIIIWLLLSILYWVNMLTYKVSESAGRSIHDTLEAVDFYITLPALVLEGCFGLTPTRGATILTMSASMAIIFILAWAFKCAVFRKAEDHK